MRESQKDQDSKISTPEYRSVSPSTYWGLGSFGSRSAITSPALLVEISSEAPVEIPLHIPQVCKPF